MTDLTDQQLIAKILQSLEKTGKRFAAERKPKKKGSARVAASAKVARRAKSKPTRAAPKKRRKARS
jgi:hypothetical protein